MTNLQLEQEGGIFIHYILKRQPPLTSVSRVTLDLLDQQHLY